MLRTLKLMNSFHVLVQSGSYFSAAKALNVEVDELDRHIFELECLLAVPLFHRRAESTTASFAHLPVIPTDSGTRWFLIIKELLSSHGPGGFEGVSSSFINCLEKTLSYLMHSPCNALPNSDLGNRFTYVMFL
jgi:hypothetical protein